MKFFIRYNPFKTFKDRKCLNVTIEACCRLAALDKFNQEIAKGNPNINFVDCVRLKDETK